MSYTPINSQTAFLPTYRDFQVDDVQLRIVLPSYLTDISYGVNIREISQYEEVELLNGQQYFTVGDPQKKRYAYRKVFQVPAIAAGAFSIIPHGITNETIFTKILGGVITNVPDYRLLPFPSVTPANIIEVTVGTTNIRVTNGTGGGPDIVSGIVILEYLKN